LGLSGVWGLDFYYWTDRYFIAWALEFDCDQFNFSISSCLLFFLFQAFQPFQVRVFIMGREYFFFGNRTEDFVLVK
jgi:hypothetical protein